MDLKGKKIYMGNSSTKKPFSQDFFRRRKTTANSRLIENKRNLVSKIYLKNKTEGLDFKKHVTKILTNT